jgi:hypothetical protein
MKYFLIMIAVSLIAVSASAFACTGFLKSEQTSGMNKICYYNHLGSTAAVNVASYAICPVTYQFNH